MKALEFGVGLFPTAPVSEMVNLAQQCELLGFDDLWIGDSHLIWREAYVTLSAIAQRTERIGLGTGVTQMVTRHFSVVASAMATLAEFAPNRVFLGLGLGDSSVQTLKLKPQRMADFERDLRSVRALFQGEKVDLGNGRARLKATGRREVPIFIAASGPKMLRLAGRIADGVIMLVGTTPAQARAGIALVEEGARESGRRIDDVKLVLWAPCSVGEAGEARRAVAAHVARAIAHPLPLGLPEEDRLIVDRIKADYDYYHHMEGAAPHASRVPDRLIDKFAICGQPDECAERVRQLSSVGIDQIAIIPYGTRSGGRLPVLEAFAQVAL